MTKDELATVRDALIAELPTPKSSAAKFEGALYDRSLRNGTKDKPATAQELQQDMDAVRTLVNAADAAAIKALAVELHDSKYDGLTAQEIYDRQLLITEEPIMADFDVFDAAGKKIGTESRKIGFVNSPVARCWQGIPYTYNTPPVEVIQRALDAK